jgi:TetR/AcrR family transcriptional repressor of nem operon
MKNHAELGRPREFALDDAARDAMQVFRDRGYEGASLPDLIEGTGLSRGSLYKAFGDKKGLLLAALDRYMAEGLQLTAEQLSQAGSARAAIRASLLRHASEASDDAGRRGCLVVAMATEQAARDPEIAARAGAMFARLQQLYAAAIVRGQTDGEFAEREPQAMARFLVCQIQGMRVLGKTGVAETEMVAMVENALRILD